MKFMLKKIRSCFIFFLVGIVITVPSLAYANPPGRIASIKKNQKAPFDGTLFDIRAAADLTLKLETSSKQCSLKIQRETSLCKADCNLKLNLKNAEHEALEQRCNDILKIKTDQIDFLQKMAVRDVPWYKTNKFWMATGVVTGFVISLASVYAIGQVAQ